MRARLEELERLQPGRAAVSSAEFWDRRAPRFASGAMGTADGDPLLRRLVRAVGRASTVVDVGAGPGRFSLALALRVSGVVAVDPSRRMLAILRRRARAEGLSNVRTVVGFWPKVEVEPADVVVCAHVLPLVADVVPFLSALDRTARRRVFVYLGAFAADAVADPFWRHVHGRPRRPPPTYLDAVAVLAEMGIPARVEVVEVPMRTRHSNLDEAVKNYLDALALPNTAPVRRELAGLLEPWLQRRDGGLRAPFRTQPAAILSWSPEATHPT